MGNIWGIYGEYREYNMEKYGEHVKKYGEHVKNTGEDL